MVRFHPTIFATVCLTTACFLSGVARAQSDKVYRNDGKVVTGKVAQVLRNGVQVDRRGKTENIPYHEINKILFQGDPPGLTRGRELALDGQYEEALEQLGSVKVAELPRDFIKAEVQFFLVHCRGKLALSGRGNRNSARDAAVSFAKGNSNSWHFYDSIRLLGNLELAMANSDQASKYFKMLGGSISVEAKIEAKYLMGTAKLANGDAVGAKTDLEQVAGVDVGSAAAARIKTLAKAKLAESLAVGGSGNQAKTMLDEIVADLDTLDIELASHVYNTRGAVFEQLGDPEGAVLAYLHTDLMFSSVPEAHALALQRLSDLWSKVGKPDRAAKAKQQLKQLYPGYSS